MGKPSADNTALLPAEYIGGAEASRGTETSQYPEERKSTETPRVVARERGAAHTGAVHSAQALPAGGCRASVREVRLSAGVTKQIDSRSAWNRAPQRAIVP